MTASSVERVLLIRILNVVDVRRGRRDVAGLVELVAADC
jgi:hypothetical protein